MIDMCIMVATMYIDTCKTGKYVRHLLRESYRDGGKVKHRTIANLSHCSDEEIEAVKLAFKHKKDLSKLGLHSNNVSLEQGVSMGAVWLVHDMARKLGIVKALGSSREGKLALWQVVARVIDQGSRLSAVRLAGSTAACDILGIKESFNEDDLYENLRWISSKQTIIENRLFRQLYPEKKPGLFLYDVTSSYLEGVHNQLATFGYNRDKKRGKKQIVIGLLCDEIGRPLSIEVFVGNTQDPATVASQIQKMSDRFGGEGVTLVGDRGMIKSKQIEDLLDKKFHYITAITKPQIEALIVRDVLQLGLFDEQLAEIETDEGIRYILRRNPVRASEIRASRDGKIHSLKAFLKKKNTYLREHPKAKPEVAERAATGFCNKLKIGKWIGVEVKERILSLTIDKEKWCELIKLDGCYVLKTDLEQKTASKETVHARYKDLAHVEWAFRTSKTVELEMRPINVRLEGSTRGHVLVVMLAYLIVQELAKRWNKLDTTVEEGIKELSTLCVTNVLVDKHATCNLVPKPRQALAELLKLADVKIPSALPSKGILVSTRKKLQENRKPVDT